MGKRIFSALFILILTMAFTACGAKPQDQTTGDTAHEGSTPASSVSQAETAYGIQDVEFFRDNMKISGELLLPDTDTPMPLVILSHGFGGNRANVREYAEVFAEHGTAAFIFDFIGGGRSIKSDGKTTEMSVLTEAADLECILDELKADDRFDPEKIFLFGESQGGFVSTYVAGDRPDDVAGLVVLYPAYVLQDNCREMTPDINDIPETMNLMGTTIGSIYNRDALSFDIYDQMKAYDGKVLIIHGTSDSIAPISYSERAVETFPDAQLIKYDGANHGFYGTTARQAAQESLGFIRELLTGSTDYPVSTMDSLEHEPEEKAMQLRIGETAVSVAWEKNESVEALKALAADKPLAIQMSMYGGFEQVGSIGQSLPRDDKQTRTSAGDIVLYSGNQLAVFYGSNSWAYTRLGHIIDQSADDLRILLGNGDVNITISYGEQGSADQSMFDFEKQTVLLNSGYEMPIIGLGTWTLNDEEAENSVYHALKCGMRLIDTARYYGNEVGVGSGLKKAIGEGIVTREDVFITTKIYGGNYERAGGIIDDALSDLGVDYIDLLLIHQPGADDEGVYKAMEDAVRDGKLRSIGISNYYTKEQIDEVLDFATIVPAVIQNENHLYYQNTELQEYVRQYGIVIESWYPFGGRGHTAESFNNEVILELAEKYNKSSAQIILRWQLQAGFIAIPGSSNPDHIAENYDIFDFELTVEEMQKISTLDRQERYENW